MFRKGLSLYRCPLSFKYTFVNFGSISEWLNGDSNIRSDKNLILCIITNEDTGQVRDYFFVKEDTINPFSFMSQRYENQASFHNFIDDDIEDYGNPKGDSTKEINEKISIERVDNGHSLDYFLILKNQEFIRSIDEKTSESKRIIVLDDLRLFLFGVTKHTEIDYKRVYYNELTENAIKEDELLVLQNEYEYGSPEYILIDKMLDKVYTERRIINLKTKFSFPSSVFINEYTLLNNKTGQKVRYKNGKVISDSSEKQQVSG